MKSSALTESKYDLQAYSNGFILSHTNYNSDILRSYYADPACWVQLPDSKQLGVQHKTNIETVYIVNLDKGEAKTEKRSLAELKSYQREKFTENLKVTGELDFISCIESRKSIGYNTQYESVLVNRKPLNTTVLDSGFRYVGSIQGRQQKDYLWWVEACNGRYGLVNTPAKTITRVMPFRYEILVLDEKGQAYAISDYEHHNPQVKKFCSASQICHIGEILKPHQEFFYTTDQTNCLTIWKTPKFSHAIKFLQFQNIIPNIKPVSTHNGKLFFLSQNGIEVCNTKTWESNTFITFEKDDQPSQLLLSHNQRRLIYINRKGINVLELGDEALFYAQNYLFSDCQLYKIANLITSYAKEDFSAEFCYEFEPVPAYEDRASLKEEPYEALAGCKFLATLPGFLRQSTQELLINLLQQADKANAQIKEEIHENIDALLFLFFLYEKFPKTYITDHINQVLREFPKILSSETSIYLKSLFDSYVALNPSEVRKRYIGFFECKAAIPNQEAPQPVDVQSSNAKPAGLKPIEKPGEVKQIKTVDKGEPEKISYKKHDKKCLIM